MTIDLNKKAKPDALQVSIFNPFYGTKLYDYSKNKGLIRGNLSKSYYTGTSLYNPNISQKELIQIRSRFAYEVYKERSLIKAYLLLLKENIVPFYIQDIVEAYNEIGPSAFFSVGVPAFFGVGVQTFEEKKGKARGVNRLP